MVSASGRRYWSASAASLPAYEGAPVCRRVLRAHCSGGRCDSHPLLSSRRDLVTSGRPAGAPRYAMGRHGSGWQRLSCPPAGGRRPWQHAPARRRPARRRPLRRGRRRDGHRARPSLRRIGPGPTDTGREVRPSRWPGREHGRRGRRTARFCGSAHGFCLQRGSPGCSASGLPKAAVRPVVFPLSAGPRLTSTGWRSGLTSGPVRGGLRRSLGRRMGVLTVYGGSAVLSRFSALSKRTADDSGRAITPQRTSIALR